MVAAQERGGRRRAVQGLAVMLGMHPVSVYRLLKWGRLPGAYKDDAGIWRMPASWDGQVRARCVRGVLVREKRAKSAAQRKSEIRRALGQAERLTLRLRSLLEES